MELKEIFDKVSIILMILIIWLKHGNDRYLSYPGKVCTCYTMYKPLPGKGGMIGTVYPNYGPIY